MTDTTDDKEPSGAERLSAQPDGYVDVVPYAAALIEAAPARALWGLDWPPSRFFKTKPAPFAGLSLVISF